jgi:HAD superfamily hydrolase (TIGR01484 family)
MTGVEARAIRAVAFDIDDTLTRDGRLERVAFDALWSLWDTGLVLVAATGRPLGLCDVVARHWPVHAAVGENGGGWVWRDPVSGAFHEGYADDAATRVRTLRRLDALRERVLAAMPHVRVTDDQRARRVDLAFDVGEHARLGADERETLRALLEAEGARAIVSSVHAHAFYGDHDKATGIRAALTAATGRTVPDDAVLFVGDSGNDAPAFAAFRASAAPRNVAHWLDTLPVPPRYVADASFGAGFAEIAHTLLARRNDG